MIEPLGGHAGMNFYDLELARGLREYGVTTRLYTCDQTLESSEPGVSILKPFRALYGSRSKAIAGLRFLRGLLWSARDTRRHRIKVVHLHYFQYGLRELACCVILKALRMRIVATAHDITPFSRPEGLSVFGTVMRLSDHVIVHNKFSAGMLADRLDSMSRPPPLSVIRHGNFIAHLKLLDSSAARRRLGLPEERPVILFFGQVKPEKGLEELLKAFARYQSEGGNGLLYVVGRPMAHAKEDYVSIAHKLGLADNVKFDLRYVSDEEASACYSAADLVVLPYREIFQSGVLLMAMSHGRPVLCSDLPAMQEVVSHGETGLIFTAGDVDALAAALSQSLGDVEALKMMGSRAAAEMAEHYSWKEIGKRTAKVYRQALGAEVANDSQK